MTWSGRMAINHAWDARSGGQSGSVQSLRPALWTGLPPLSPMGRKEPPSFAKRSSASSSEGKRPRQRQFRRRDARRCGVMRARGRRHCSDLAHMLPQVGRQAKAAWGPAPQSVDGSDRTRAPSHLEPHPGKQIISYIRESSACASIHTLGWVVASSWPCWTSPLPDASASRLSSRILCKQVIERGEHRLVIECDGALAGSRCGVRFTVDVGGGFDGGSRHPAGHLRTGGLPGGVGDRERVREVTTRDAVLRRNRFTIR